MGSEEPDIFTNRQSSLAKQRLHDHLIHATRRCEDTTSRIRYVGHLEQSLDRAVFTEWTMEHWKNQIEFFGSKTTVRIERHQPLSGRIAQYRESARSVGSI